MDKCFLRGLYYNDALMAMLIGYVKTFEPWISDSESKCMLHRERNVLINR